MKNLFIELTPNRRENAARYSSVNKVLSTIKPANFTYVCASGYGYYGMSAIMVEGDVSISTIKKALKDKPYFSQLKFVRRSVW